MILPSFRRRAFAVDRWLLAFCAAAILVFLLLPLAALLWRAFPGSLAGAWTRPVALQALRLSLATTAISTGLTILIGTPVAYLLARYRFPGHAALDTLIDLPTVLPPAVAGLALLMAFGRRGLVGGLLAHWGLVIAFTPVAVVMAQTFVAAPFYLRAAQAGFAGVDRRLEQMSATLGASPPRTFLRITLPLAGPSLVGGAIMTWARALGEFGATLMFAGNFMGRTQTMPLAIYSGLESDLDAALALAAILLVTSFAFLLLFRLVSRRSLSHA